MSVKDDVLGLLTDRDGPLSGEWLARKLGVTRNAVWKAIEALRREGFVIEAATNRGYRLVSGPEILSIPQIKKWMRPGEIGTPMEIHSRLDSTNRLAKLMAADGALHGFLVLAESQSSGRGRMGRSFFSPEHTGVYATYILRPHMHVEQAVLLTSLAAVAVARAIEAVADVEVRIKWVNDLYINGKKVCGILCEAGMDFESGQLEYAVLGIGVNVTAMAFPEALSGIATSIENECGAHVSRSRLIAEITNQLNDLYPQLATGAFMPENRSRSNVIGREVEVLQGDRRYMARAMDIDERGRLVVKTPNGIVRLDSGEVSLRFAR
ncbi:MAG: biotin--[Clostridia bacterium]|nr:biotin--[acetyl-CoA-carboxylase] ligase [Clostridia bacterium]